MYRSVSTTLKSRILQSLFIQQIKLSKSILMLTGKHDLTGQGIMCRSIIETAANIAWLLLSPDNNKFDNYIAHGLRASNDTVNDMNYDEESIGHELPIQARLKESSYDKYRMAGLSKTKIKYFLNLSHSKLNKIYPHINTRQKIHMLNSMRSAYLTYSVLSNETHSNFSEVVNRNTNKSRGKFIGNVDTNYGASEPRMIDPTSILLIHSFNIMNKLKCFVFPDNYYKKMLIRRLRVLDLKLSLVEYYDERLVQKND